MTNAADPLPTRQVRMKRYLPTRIISLSSNMAQHKFWKLPPDFNVYHILSLLIELLTTSFDLISLVLVLSLKSPIKGIVNKLLLLL